VKGALIILAAFCVAFTMAASSSGSGGSGQRSDYVTNGLLCIHQYEGAWNDPGSPYYGGLQMDYNFMQAYGAVFYRRWGTADHWPVWAQIQAGRNGYRARGWYPWPVSSRTCGLLS
jgi:hypothetical protein